MRHDTGARANSRGRGEASRVAYRTAMVTTRRQPDLTRRQSRGGASRRPSGGQRRVPWICRGAKHLVERLRPRTEFRRVGLGDHQRTIGFEHLDHEIRTRRDIVGKGHRTVGGTHTGHIAQVLHGNRQTMKISRSIRGIMSFGELLSALTGAIETERWQRVQDTVRLGDPGFGGIQQLKRG